MDFAIPRLPRNHFARSDQRQGLLFIAFGFAIVSMLAVPGFAGGAIPTDAERVVAWWLAARGSVLAGEGFPFWDRLHCGGVTFIGNPQAPILSAFLFAWIRLPTAMFYALSVATVGALSGLGAVMFARRSLHFAWITSITFAAAWVFNPVVYLPMITHGPGFAAGLLPWVLLALFEGSAWASIAGACATAIALWDGDSQTFFLIIPLIVFVAWARWVSFARPWFATCAWCLWAILGLACWLKIISVSALLVVFAVIALVAIFVARPGFRGWLFAVGVFGLLSFVLNAPRLLAVLEALSGPTEHPSALPITYQNLLSIFVDSHPEKNAVLQTMFGANVHPSVGPFAAMSAIAGAGAAWIVAPRRPLLPVFLIVAIALLLGAADASSIYSVLLSVRPWGAIETPASWFFFANFAVIACAFVALDAAQTSTSSIAVRIVTILVCGAIVTEQVVISERTLATNGFESAPQAEFARNAFRYNSNKPPIELALQREGGLDCPFSWATTNHASGNAIEVPVRASIGKVLSQRATSDEFRAEVEAPRHDYITFATAFNEDWVASNGETSRGSGGMLQWRPDDSGRQSIVVFYRPMRYRLGLAASGLLGLASVLYIALKKRWIRSITQMFFKRAAR